MKNAVKLTFVYSLMSIFLKLTKSNLVAISFDPPTNFKLKESSRFVISVNLTKPLSKDLENDEEIFITSQNPNIAKLTNISSARWIACGDEICKFFEFEIEGIFVGWATFEVRKAPILSKNEIEPENLLGVYRVGVLRGATFSMLSTIFAYTMSVLVCINTFVMGLQLDWKIIIAVLRRPIAPIIGFCCQFIIMPLLSFGWASLLLQGMPSLQFGYFAVGCAPGGGASNFWTLLLGGNLDLSVTMTFCSNVAALAMMPLWLLTLGQIFFRDLGAGQISIPFENILLSLALLIVPCLLGILTKHFKPTIAEKSKKVIKIFTLIVVGVAIIFGTVANTYVYSLITWKTVLCGMLLPYCGFAISYVIGLVFKQSAVNCRTIAIETGIQNANIAIVLLNFSLAKPDSDLTLVMPVCVLLFTPLPLIVILICKNIYEKFHKKKETDEKSKEKSAYTNSVKISDELPVSESNIVPDYNLTVSNLKD